MGFHNEDDTEIESLQNQEQVNEWIKADISELWEEIINNNFRDKKFYKKFWKEKSIYEKNQIEDIIIHFSIDSYSEYYFSETNEKKWVE